MSTRPGYDSAVTAFCFAPFMRGMTAGILVASWFACAGTSSPALYAQQTSQPAEKKDSDTAVLLDLNSKTHTGTLTALDGDSLQWKGTQAAQFHTRELISLRFPGRITSLRLPRGMVFLANGDRLAIEVDRLEADKVTCHWKDFRDAPPVVIPVETVHAIGLNLPQTDFAQRQTIRELLDRRESSDLFVLANHDRLSGELQTIDKTFVSLAGAAGNSRVERGNINWIGMNRELISFPKHTGSTMKVALTDGSRITVRNCVLSENTSIRLNAVFGGEFVLPASSLSAVLFLGEKVTYLSDLEAAEYEFNPFLSTKWLLRNDRSVDGGPLLMRGAEYLKGLGTHSQNRIRYHLGGSYRQFRSLVGIDDSAGGRGSARFVVEIDGRQAFRSGELTGMDPPAAVGPIDVQGAQELVLRVEYGAIGDILDRADWCDALLVK